MLDLASQAAKQKSAPLFPLAAPLSENGIGFVPSTLAENSHPGSEGKSEPRVGPWASVSSTSHWAYPLCSYESASARLDQRYYNANQGRFWTPDPSGMMAANPRNPSSWNQYAYVKGDPVNDNDPDGLGIFGNIWNAVKDIFSTGGGDDESEAEEPAGEEGAGGGEGPSGYNSAGDPIFTASTSASSGTSGSSIISVSVTSSVPGILVGSVIGDLFGPAAGFVGGLLGSLCGAGGNISYVPVTRTLYAGPTASCSISVLGGSGGQVSVVSVPKGQDPNQIANGTSYSVTYQPTPATGSTVIKSPGSGAPVVGVSAGTRVPVSVGVGTNICLFNCQ